MDGPSDQLPDDAASANAAPVARFAQDAYPPYLEQDARQRTLWARMLRRFHIILTASMMRGLWFCRTHNPEFIPERGAALLICNHPSYLDPMFLVSTGVRFRWRLIRFMAWDKLFRIPVLNGFLRSYGAWPVNLEKPGRAPYEQLVRTLRSGGIAGIFPEAGRSKGVLMGEWKPGALRAAAAADCVILPVTQVGADRAWPKQAWVPRIFCRIDMVFHKPRKLEEFCARLPGEPEKAWLVRVESAVRDVINEPIARRLRSQKAAALLAYRRATPPDKRSMGQRAIRADVFAPMRRARA